MTREEALYWLDTIPTIGEQVDALEMAIKALSQEPCDDAISREDALMCLTGMFKLPLNYKPEDLIALFSKRIKELPSVTQKSGKWIEKEGWDGDVYYECSMCGEAFCLIDGTPTDNMYNYCPSCGVKMVEPQESEDKE